MLNDKKQNGTERGGEIYDDFIEWKRQVSTDEIKEITQDGCLNRTEVAKAVGCSRSAMYSNRMKDAIIEFEAQLRHNKTLSECTVSTLKSKMDKNLEPKIYDNSSRQLSKALTRISVLEKENMELKTDLKRFGELGKIIAEGIG